MNGGREEGGAVERWKGTLERYFTLNGIIHEALKCNDYLDFSGSVIFS